MSLGQRFFACVHYMSMHALRAHYYSILPTLLLLLGGGQVPIILKCFSCEFSRANQLFTNKCLQRVAHEGGEEQQVCRCSTMKKLVAIKSLPGNEKRMREQKIRYAFTHSDANCSATHGSCGFPHSHIEEEAWNLLLYGATPQPKVGTVMQG